MIENGRRVDDSPDNTFDLIVDGDYAEMKVKKRTWAEFDFISLTANQKEALGNPLKRIFLVLNVGQPGHEEIVEINAEELLQCRRNEIQHYEWNKGDIKHLRRSN